ncbi:RDD family protein [Massilia sp. MS-15]|uniref:RDD family protein n=1 Tax=Massilia sp. MS-15 TaxID=2878200 RepID=UPI001CD33E95|nr:RDD family protein [Massilia sp. MS-15]MCA1245092.1 RDD family protein [Massilia sp. MS-15]
MSPSKPVPVATPSILRRVTAMLYEALLLFAVEMLAIAAYMLVTLNSQHPLAREGMKLWLLLVTAAYFMWCWIDSGHTLAMKTWRIKVVKLGCHKLPLRTAAARFLLAWGWFAPALAVCWAFGLHDKAQVGIALALGVAAWALTALFDKDRQFLHDRLAGTRLIALPKAPRKAARQGQPG